MKDPKSQANNLPSNKSASKPRRVSHRRELAVVTLAAVASIAGVSGLLVTDQSNALAAQPTGSGERPNLVAPTLQHGDGGQGDENDSDDHGVIQPARARPAQVQAPSRSATSPATFHSVSRGS